MVGIKISVTQIADFSDVISEKSGTEILNFQQFLYPSRMRYFSDHYLLKIRGYVGYADTWYGGYGPELPQFLRLLATLANLNN